MKRRWIYVFRSPVLAIQGKVWWLTNYWWLFELDMLYIHPSIGLHICHVCSLAICFYCCETFETTFGLIQNALLDALVSVFIVWCCRQSASRDHQQSYILRLGSRAHFQCISERTESMDRHPRNTISINSRWCQRRGAVDRPPIRALQRQNHFKLSKFFMTKVTRVSVLSVCSGIANLDTKNVNSHLTWGV